MMGLTLLETHRGGFLQPAVGPPRLETCSWPIRRLPQTRQCCRGRRNRGDSAAPCNRGDWPRLCQGKSLSKIFLASQVLGLLQRGKFAALNLL